MRMLSGSLVLLAVMLAGVGCGEHQHRPKDTPAKGKEVAKNETKHDVWWCQEHGIPEDECSLCNSKVAAKLKKAGDWCEIHQDRAKSQCFKCDPALYKGFEAKYIAKYNKKPEPPPEEEFKK